METNFKDFIAKIEKINNEYGPKIDELISKAGDIAYKESLLGREKHWPVTGFVYKKKERQDMKIKREDVIVDPKDPRVEGLIGKKVFFSDIFSRIQKQEYTGVLTNVLEKSDFPFKNDEFAYAMIAPIPEPTYRPFKSAKEFASYAEKWCKPKDNEADFCCRIIDFSDNGVTIPDSYSPKEDVKFICISFKEAFEDFCFEDGTPFGVEI